MRVRSSAWWLAAVALVLLALTHLHATDSSGGGGVGFVRAAPAQSETAAFNAEDDDDFASHTLDDEDDATPVRAAPAAAKPSSAPAASRPASSAPASAASKGSASSATSALEFDADEIAELLADEDEFVGVVPDKAKSAGKAKRGAGGAKGGDPSAADTSDPTIANVLNRPSSFFQPIGVWEVLGLVLLAVFLINFLVGSRRNRALAFAFARSVEPLLAEQFAAVGADAAAGRDEVSASDAPEAKLQKEAAYIYRLYASGRRHCDGLLCTLDLVPRQELFSYALTAMQLIGGATASLDTLTVEIPLDDSAPPIVFALLKRSHLRALLKANPDVEALASPAALSTSAATAAASAAAHRITQHKGMDGYACISELPGGELESELVTDRVARVLARPSAQALFLSLVISDQCAPLAWSIRRKVLRAQFVLPHSWSAPSAASDEDSPASALHSLLLLCFALVDRVSDLSLSGAALARLQTRRQRLAEAATKASHAERQSALQQRKEEERRKEMEIIRTDPNSEQAKALKRKKEARDAKLAKKQSMAGRVKVMR